MTTNSSALRCMSLFRLQMHACSGSSYCKLIVISANGTKWIGGDYEIAFVRVCVCVCVCVCLSLCTLRLAEIRTLIRAPSSFIHGTKTNTVNQCIHLLRTTANINNVNNEIQILSLKIMYSYFRKHAVVIVIRCISDKCSNYQIR